MHAVNGYRSRAMDWYAVLGVDQAASFEDIKQAYRRAILQVHPDKNNDQSGEQFIAVSAAYKALSDPAERERYDSQFGKRARSDVDSDALKNYFAEKLRAQEQLAAQNRQAQLNSERPKGTTKGELAGWMEALQSVKPRTHSNHIFNTVAEARQFVDTHRGERLIVPYGDVNVDETLERIRKRAQHMS